MNTDNSDYQEVGSTEDNHTENKSTKSFSDFFPEKDENGKSILTVIDVDNSDYQEVGSIEDNHTENKSTKSFSDFFPKKDENGKPILTVINVDNSHLYEEEKKCCGHVCEYTRYHDYYKSSDDDYNKFLDPETLVVHEYDPNFDPWGHLDVLVGLKGVKKQLHQIKCLVEFDKKRAHAGFSSLTLSNHMVFSGNPGTGKNEVARVVGSVLKRAGLLSKGHVVEVDRSDLIRGWVGQSESKTREILDYARGGVLFIDEAYMLFKEEGRDFGSEVVAVLLKYMEDFRDDIVVILAGYKEEMKTLLSSNPGLKSRVRHKVDFPDYSEEELTKIFVKFCKDYGYVMQEEAHETLHNLIKHTKLLNTSDLGNGRFIRNSFERTLEKMASRVIDMNLDTETDQSHLNTILFSDIPRLEEVIGAEAKSLKLIEDKLR